SGITQLKLLRCRKAHANISLRSVVGEVCNVGRLPGLRQIVFGIVDAVLLSQAESCRSQCEGRLRWAPVQAAFITPRGFGLKIGISDRRRVRVVEVEISRQPIAMTYRRARTQRRCKR